MVQLLEMSNRMFLTFLRVPQKVLTNIQKVISFLKVGYYLKGKTFSEEYLNGGLSFLTFLNVPHLWGFGDG